MPVEAKVICDSISEAKYRLTTVEVKIHRFVLAELNTHRAFSRNSASSRAIPVEKMLERVSKDPALPLHWGKNQKGMQAEGELSEYEMLSCQKLWLQARDNAVRSVEDLRRVGLHKQVANRLLEPFMWHTVIISATEWENFYAQRCHPAAQPEMRAAAEAIRVAIAGSTPTQLNYNEWHLPYISSNEGLAVDLARKVSVARCARVSYLTHDGVRDVRVDLEMFDKLAMAVPPHASPFEHVAAPTLYGPMPYRWGYGPSGNFGGWKQLRHVLFPQLVQNLH